MNALNFYTLKTFLADAKNGFPTVKRFNAERIYLPADTKEEVIEACQALSKEGKEIIVSLPYIMRGRAAEEFKKNIDNFCGFADGFLLQNIGDFACEELCKAVQNNNKILCGDYALNVTNYETAAFFAERRVLSSLAILPELTVDEQLELAEKFPDNITPEICIDGNVVVMRSEHCFAAEKEGYHCGVCGKYGESAPPLTDARGKIYPIICNPLDCNSILLAPTERLATNTFVERPLKTPRKVIFRYSVR